MITTVDGAVVPETTTATLTLQVAGSHRTVRVEVPVVPATIRPDGGVIDVRALIPESILVEMLERLVTA